MNRTVEAKNKALVLEAFDTLFNKRNYAAAEKFWSPHYMQHSAHIAPGREGLFDLIKSLPPTLKYESGTIVAEGNVVVVHGRLSTSPVRSAESASDSNCMKRARTRPGVIEPSTKEGRHEKTRSSRSRHRFADHR